MSELPTENVNAQLGFEKEIGHLCDLLRAWIDSSSDEIHHVLDWQFLGKSKYFRPLTVFSCYRAIYSGPIPTDLTRSAAVLEMLHNMSLIIDDILDESSQRRGKQTLHCKFGLLHALMVSGYIVADGYQMVADSAFDIQMFSELLKRLGAAECL